MSQQNVFDPALGWALNPNPALDFRQSFRANVLFLQEKMNEHEQVECPVKHHFSGNSYAREIFMPAGTLVVGKIHRHAHLNVISQGECYVLTEGGVEHLKAPITFVSLPETKRVVYCVNDVIWTTCHVTDNTDVGAIENELIAPTYNDLDPCLLSGVIECLG